MREAAPADLCLKNRAAFTVAPSFTLNTFVETVPPPPPNRSVSVARRVPSPDTVTSEFPP